jgi:hypothetical protein
MAEEKLCGRPHSLGDSWRCVVPVDERGVHIASHLGWCLCSCASKDETEFYYDKSGQRKTSIKTS